MGSTVTRSTIRADVGVAIVPLTISRHLAEANLKSKRPFRALPLTPEHRQRHLQWCQARSMWNKYDAFRRQIYHPISKEEQVHHSSADGKSVSCCLRKADLPKTVATRLRGGRQYARRAVVCVPLTRQHRTDRLQWCREHHNWTEQDWACVLFSDESRLSLSSVCRRQLIWRESGTAYRPENIQENDRYPTCSIMVWAGIMIIGRTRLHVVANGTMTGQRYIDEVLLPHVRLFRGAVGDKFVFMDIATCHRTLAVQGCLDSEGIQRLVWPARSPDLNPIENVWDTLGRQVAGRNYPPTNKNTLIRALTEEWDKLPQQLLDNVVCAKYGWSTRRVTGQVDHLECAVRNCWEQWTRGRYPRAENPVLSDQEDHESTHGNQLKRQMLPCHSVHDLEWVAQDLWAPLPQDSIKVSNQLNAGPCGVCITTGGGPKRY
ncbi:transposable element Tcb2 transposase [Trichonephila clavipes]|nr:transposable element Tcb2 transposase [Trichonephila clavipes]